MSEKRNTAHMFDQNAGYPNETRNQPVRMMLMPCPNDISIMAEKTDIPAEVLANIFIDINRATPEQIMTLCAARGVAPADLTYALHETTMPTPVLDLLMRIVQDEGAETIDRATCLKALADYVDRMQGFIRDESMTTGAVSQAISDYMPCTQFNAPLRRQGITLQQMRQFVDDTQSLLLEDLGWEIYRLGQVPLKPEKLECLFRGVTLRIGLLQGWSASKERLAQCCYIVNALDKDKLEAEFGPKLMPQRFWLGSVLRKFTFT